MKNTAKELLVNNLVIQLASKGKGNLASDLMMANKELAFQHGEKKKRAYELTIANKELAYQNKEKAKRADELIIAKKELAFQNEEKEKRADELIIANKELAFQDREKKKRSNELIVANKELAFQNEEKEKRADELVIANKELAFQNMEKRKRSDELIIANEELAFQGEEKEKRADELLIANKELDFQNKEKQKRSDELIIANKELAYQGGEKEKRADELVIANKELDFQKTEKRKRSDELIIANKELAFQGGEKEKRADELIIANKELAYQNKEKEKRADELIIANKELAYQNKEKEKRADELIIANKELAYQNKEKEKRADELIIANKELAYQNKEKEKRADELLIANKELAYQNSEKEKRADELLIANRELAYQNMEKELRANELIAANKELAFQNEEKGKRADELVVANEVHRKTNEYLEKLLNYANAPIIVWNTHYEITRFNRAFELVTGRSEKEVLGKSLEILFPASQKAASMKLIKKTLVGPRMEVSEMSVQNVDGTVRILLWNSANIMTPDGKEPFATIAQGNDITSRKDAEQEVRNLNENLENIVIERTKQLEAAYKELEAFSYSISHDLRAPLRHIGGFVDLLVKNNSAQLNESGLRYLNIITDSSSEMGNLIDALLTFSRLSSTEIQKTRINTKKMVERILSAFSDELEDRNVEIILTDLPDVMGDETLIRQVWANLFSNALKYSRNKEKAVIDIGGERLNGKVIFHVKDNGTGFDMMYADKLFGVFQRLHKAKDFEGIGIGLANVQRIVVRHGGECWAESEEDKGAQFFFSLPDLLDATI